MYSYRITAVSNVAVFRRDYLTARDVPVAVDEDLNSYAELRVVQVPGTSNGTATLVRRTNGSNATGKTIKPNHPFYVSVSALRNTVDQTALPFSKTGTSP